MPQDVRRPQGPKQGSPLDEHACGPDGLYAFGPRERSALHILDTRTGKEIWSQPWAFPDNISVIAFMPDSRRIFLGGMYGWMKLADVSSHQATWRVGLQNRGISADAFADGGKLLATADRPRHGYTEKEWLEIAGREEYAVNNAAKHDVTLRLWQADTDRELARVDWDGPSIGSVAFSHDGRRLATGMSDGTIVIWDVKQVISK